MASFADISIRVNANLKQFSTQMQTVDRNLQRTGKKLQGLGKQLSVGLTAPLGALAVASVRAFDKQAKAIAQVESALESTGMAAGRTLTQLKKQASELQNNSLFGDEEILTNVTAQIATFTNITEKQFDRVQQASLDLATRLAGDGPANLKGASIQLGKALNDPKAGLSALGKSGIQFSEDQKSVINSLAESGRLAEAQNIILEELEKQYGGAAAAAAKAGTGPLKQLSNILGDITEDFGKIIVEAIAPFVASLKEIALRFQALSPETKKWIVVLGGVAAAIGPLLALAGTILPALVAGFTLLTGPVGLAVAAISAVGVGFVSLSNRVASNVKELNRFTSSLISSSLGVENNLGKIDLLIKEYDDLKGKSSLNSDEQDRLKRVISELSKQMPSAITSFDEYGNALDVNSGKVKRFLTDQSKLNKLQAKVNLSKLEGGLVALQKEQSRLNSLNKDGNSLFVEGVGHVTRLNGVLGRGRGSRFNALGDEAVLLVQKRIASNREDVALTEENIRKNKELLDVLNGLKNVNEEKVVEKNKQGNFLNQPKKDTDSDIKNKDLIIQEIPLKFTNGNFSSIEAQVINDVANLDKSVPDLFYEVPLMFTNNEFETGATQVINTAQLLEQRLARLAEVGNAVGGSVAGAFEGMSNRMVEGLGLASDGLEGFVGGLVQTVTKLIALMLSSSISQAIAGATASGAATGPAAVFTTPAFIATAVGGVVSAFAAIPKFADGGIVSGPTLGLMGEYNGARTNPEVIAPLDKLKNLIEPVGGGGMAIVGGDITVKGSDLKLALSRQDRIDNRRK